MSREIKFRAKNQNGNWVYGYYVKNRHGAVIYDIDVVRWEIDEKTLGQYTGLKDKNGKEIYEGDIVNLIPFKKWSKEEDRHMSGIREVIFNEKEARFAYQKFIPMNWGGFESLEIISNIYENEELLKKVV